MRKKPDKKTPWRAPPRPWKPLPLPLPKALPPQPAKPVLPKPAKPGDHRREVFEPVMSGPIELDKFATEVIFRLRDADGEREIKSCYGDIYKVINALVDYARLLELTCDEWGLEGYHRAVYELYAKDFRAIAKKYQEAIGYDYDAAVARCEAKKKRKRKDEDIGGDALELALKRGTKK